MQVMATTLTLGPALRAILTVIDYRAITNVLVVRVITHHMTVEAVGGIGHAWTKVSVFKI